MSYTAVVRVFTWPCYRGAFSVGPFSVLREVTVGEIIEAAKNNAYVAGLNHSWVTGRDVDEALDFGMIILVGSVPYDPSEDPVHFSMEYRVPHYGICVTGTDDGYVRFANDGKLFAGHTGYSSNSVAPLARFRQIALGPRRWNEFSSNASMATEKVEARVKSRGPTPPSSIMDALNLQNGLQTGLLSLMWNRRWNRPPWERRRRDAVTDPIPLLPMIEFVQEKMGVR